MAQQGEINQNESVQGLFTEGSPLNFPPGATVRDENFILNTDGSRERRLGLGIEPSSVFNYSGYINAKTYVFDWDAVGNNGNRNFAVIISSGRISFYDKSASPLSSGYITSYAGFFVIGEPQASTTVINGDLILAGMSGGEVQAFSYDESTNTISKDTYNIKVRDIWGVDDPLDVDERPTTLTPAHAYNIANQGWKYGQALQVRNVGIETEVLTTGDPLGGTFEQETVLVSDSGGWPSNADLVTYGISEADTEDRFKQELYKLVPFGTTPAPKGAAVVRLTNMGADREEFVKKRRYTSYVDSSVYNDYNSGGPKAVAAYAGRVFYAGFVDQGNQRNDAYPSLVSTVVFSKSVGSQEDISKCYQEGDPTTLDSEIVASDGGTLNIAGSGFIYKLLPTGRSLLVFASQGIWEIYSTEQLFSATNYQVRKLTDVGCKSSRSIIMVESLPMYWTDYGIYALQVDSISDSYTPTNITASTIQSYYDDIDAVSVRDAVGFYDKFDKKARWLFSVDRDNPADMNRELVFDSKLQSWYTNVYPATADRSIVGMVSLNAFSEVSSDEDVAVDNQDVLVNTDQVIVNERIPEKGKRSFKYVIANFAQNDYEFHEFNRGDFKDFGETDAAAVMITGPYTGGDSIRRKSSSYLTMQLRKTETGFQFVNGELVPINPGSCTVETRWDWTDLAVAGKFNNPIEMYRHRRHYFPSGVNDEYEDGNTVVTTKSRLRGSGKSLALKITSSPEKDLNLLGWNIQVNQNQKV